MLQLPIYLDNNATTRCDDRVVEAMLPYFTRHYGNAASNNHSFGWEAEEAVNNAREQVAALIAAEPGEIVFTSGATEAVNLAIKGVFESYASKGNHIITCAIEHKAVLDTCKHLEKNGADVTYLPVNRMGSIEVNDLEAAIKPSTILIAIMFANNEIGTIMPVKQISEVARKNGILFFSDGTQAAGKIPVDVNNDAIDLFAFSSHKLYGPKGVGALYVRRKQPRVKLVAQIDGGGHEKGIRSGTLNVPGIVGFGKACQLCLQQMIEDSARVRELRDKLEIGLSSKEIVINGDKEHRLPNVSNISFRNVPGQALLRSITKRIAVSSGSACTSATPEPSHVLAAIGVNDELAQSSIRFSLGRFTTKEEIDFTIKEVKEKLSEIKDHLSAVTGNIIHDSIK